MSMRVRGAHVPGVGRAVESVRSLLCHREPRPCVRVYAMDTPFPIRMFVGHLSNVDCVAWHPNANYVASGSADRTLRLWDLSDGECVRVFAGTPREFGP